eukprot:TRINITY_DN73948_c0_g1_i1.p1 TRINITY_DN73948_c0_g1~~TRINITY_DN73948_c0_g1_i1.p1  ORF type:complete len:577 (+),score=84.71 TRINITY_DN73948_c0_g1_i1:39-1769(+)
MFASDNYDGLPFVGRLRLQEYFERWDEDDADCLETRDLLQRYFQAQEKAYHDVLVLAEMALADKDYWLDWTMPRHRYRRPLWTSSVTWFISARLEEMAGRADQVESPGRAVNHFSNLFDDLCRLVAFIQMSSFEVLYANPDSVDHGAMALRQVGEILEGLEQFAAAVAAGLRRPRMSTRFSSVLSDRRVEINLKRQEKAAADTRVNDLVRANLARLKQSQRSLRDLASAVETHHQRAGKLSHWQRNKPVYAIVGSIGVFGALIAFRKHSTRLAFLDRVRNLCWNFYFGWILQPLDQFSQQLFRRLGTGGLLKLKIKELRAEEETLERMILQFSKILDLHGEGPGLAERYFEESMNNPITNMMQGHLLESCMVMSQRMKVLLYASLHSIDEVLESLKWDFLMAGIMPFTTLCLICYWAFDARRYRRQLAVRRDMIRALTQIDRFLNHHSESPVLRRCAENEPSCVQTPVMHRVLSRSGSQESFRARSSSWTPWSSNVLQTLLDDPGSESLELEKVGAGLCHLHALCQLAFRLRIENLDWRSFRRDILDLTSPEFSVQQKLHVISTMRHAYPFFKQES